MPSSVCLAFVLIALRVGSDQSPAAEAARRDVVAACKDRAKVLEKQIETREMARKGTFSDLDTDLLRFSLALLRHDLAMYEQKPEEQIRQARVTVDLWERQVERIRKLSAAGAASPFELVTEEHRLACFRGFHAMASGKDREAIEQLAIVIDSADKRLAVLKKLLQAAAVAEREVDDELRRVAFARYVKLRLEGDTAAAGRSLRQVIDLDTKHLERVLKLRERSSASEAEELLVRDRLSRSRFRQSLLDDNSMAAIRELEQQVQFWEKLLKNAKAGGVSEEEISAVKHLLAHSRDRLASGRVGLSKVVEDHPVLELLR